MTTDWAMREFNAADEEDRAGLADQGTARTFYAGEFNVLGLLAVSQVIALVVVVVLTVVRGVAVFVSVFLLWAVGMGVEE